jgi:hypothetical protein
MNEKETCEGATKFPGKARNDKCEPYRPAGSWNWFAILQQAQSGFCTGAGGRGGADDGDQEDCDGQYDSRE